MTDEHVKASLESAAAALAMPDLPGFDLMKQGVATHQADLLRGLRQTLDAILDGPQVSAGAVDVRLLVDTLGPLQESLAAIGQVLQDRPTNRAPVPQALRAATQLRVVETFAGSFGVRLEGPEDTAPATLFGEGEEPSVFSEAVGRLLGLVQAAHDDDAAAMLETMASLGPRTATHVRALAKTFAESDDSLRLRWGNDIHRSEVTFGRTEASRLRDTMAEIEQTEREVWLEGHLVGASTVRKSFEFETTDETVVKGDVSPAVVGYLRLYFDRPCRARVHVSVARSLVDGSEAESYSLLALDEI